MSTMNWEFFGKIANPDFALAALHNTDLHGEFTALVRLAEPDKHPTGVKVIEIHAEDLLTVRIRCDQMEHVVEDGNILRIELSEYISEIPLRNDDY